MKKVFDTGEDFRYNIRCTIAGGITMRLDLRDIIHAPGAQKSFDETLDLSQVELFGERPFQRPVHISGTVRNMAGALELTGRATGRVDTRCDRCLKPIQVEVDVPVDTLLAEELEDEESDEIVLLEDGGVDLEELFATACILSWDGKHLCREDCKGLCPKCGKDLNEGPCGCGKELDPRFAVLAKLLDQDPEGPEEV